MPEFSLSEIAQLSHSKLIGDGLCKIDSLITDSRKVLTGNSCLFFAISGERHNGHTFIDELIGKGVINFVIEEINFPVNHYPNINFIVAKNSIQVLQQIAIEYRKQLNMPILGITGSNGKTVIKEWLFQSLSPSITVTRSPRSYNSQIGVPLSVWSLNASAQLAILEAGISLPGEMVKLQSIIQPQYGIFTNIGQAHQENFKTLEDKVNEKLNLFIASKTLQYCAEYEIITQVLSQRKDLQNIELVIWSRKNKAAFMHISHEWKKNDHTHVQLWVNKKMIEISIPFTDAASIENCLHIICFLLYHKNTTEYIQTALQNLTPLSMRLEQIKGNNGCTIINDSYNSDLNSLKIALDLLTLQHQNKKKALILSDILQTGLQNEQLYDNVKQLILPHQLNKIIVIGPNISMQNGFPINTERYNNTAEFLKTFRSQQFEDMAILIKGAREFGFERLVKLLAGKKHITTLEINLNHLVFNLNQFRKLTQPGTHIMVMVKALSYGSGGYEIANLLQHEKVDYLGVAFADEGVELRKYGITLPIMVMSPTDDSFDDIIENGLEPEIFSFQSLNKFSKAVTLAQMPEYPIHLKLDTGMHRLGFLPTDIPLLLERLADVGNLKVKAIFSHLAVTDNPDEDDFTNLQLDRFKNMYDKICVAIGYRPIRHILNSAGIERFPGAHFEMVRLGIGLHGISSTNLELKLVSTLKTQIIQIKKIAVSETIGYNRRGRLNRDSVIGIIPIGYADGLDRKFGNRNGKVWINHQLADFIGDICMDMSMVDITDCQAEEGDEVVIFGEQLPIYELAKQVGTIPYEILTNVSTRVKRIYINE